MSGQPLSGETSSVGAAGTQTVGGASGFPRRSDVTEWRKVGQDTLVLHLTLKQYHILNHVAGRIWALCDGTRSKRDIAGDLAQTFRADADAVLRDVEDTLQGFQAMGILAAEGGRGSGP
ncbi:MAG: hypothetical protein Tsb0019_22970 [Roseibium sp.]